MIFDYSNTRRDLSANYSLRPVGVQKGEPRLAVNFHIIRKGNSFCLGFALNSLSFLTLDLT